MRIVLIGAGNVAAALGKRFNAAGHQIMQVFSRTIAGAAILAHELNANAAATPHDLLHDADIYVVAISDSGLYEIKNWLNVGHRLVVHTAGSVSMDVLEETSSNYGVLYPLQSLRKEASSDAMQIPFLIDGNTPASRQSIKDLAGSISDNVELADDDARKKLHLAAVMANNFTNHLYVLTEEYCNRERINFRLLQPLISETGSRLTRHSPSLLQTGPAARHDTVTLEKHRRMLQEYPELRRLYDLFSDEIMEKIRM